MLASKPLLNVFLTTSCGCFALACVASSAAKAEIEIDVSLKERYATFGLKTQELLLRDFQLRSVRP